MRRGARRRAPARESPFPPAARPPDPMESQPPVLDPPVGESLVFVYGTSLRGEAGHAELRGARYVGEARTRAQFDLVDLGGFPGLIDGGTSRVEGELYALQPGLVRQLDEIEDHPEYFRRTEIALEDGQRVFAYLLPESQGRPYPRIHGGSWRGHPARPRSA